ncbi:hypothetical protein ACHAXA_003104 [Cyclostephanos tholiformis]|uniref:4-hydroxy-4-methyl-2-oxoglutarate aldolase n=1 Tax=Cyclostephanos tholiformis TaxID=382380 RepID=A0ABD3SSH5_9STRA
MSSSSPPSTPPPPPPPPTPAVVPSLADLCDAHVDSPTRPCVVEPGLLVSYGRRRNFHGRIETVSCFESNPSVRSVLSTPGNGRVLIVDGGGSKRTALLGDEIAKLAMTNSWSGIIINGCIRDSGTINNMDVGVKAIGTHPVRSVKTHPGMVGVNVNFGGVEFVPGFYVYSDEDGVMVSEMPLHGLGSVV